MALKRVHKIGLGMIAALLVSVVGALWLGSALLDKRGATSLVQLKGIGAPFKLIDHKGETITEAAMAGQPAAVFFGFTHCPEVCPTTLFELSEWMEALNQEMGPKAEALNAFFISVDPERDTPAVMNEYVTAFSDRVTGITGDPQAVRDLAKAWFVYSNKVPLEDGDYTMDHTASIYLVDKRGNLKSTISFGENHDVALEKLRALLQT